MARPGLQKHPKFRRLVHMLQLPTPYVVGLLECLWEVAYECGDDRIGDSTDVELAAQWPGDSGKLCDALLTCGGIGRAGFVDKAEDGTFQVHDLFDHAPDYVLNRRKKEAERQKDKQCEHCGSDYRSTEPHSRFCADRCRTAHHRQKRSDDTHDTHCDEAPRFSDTHDTHCDEPPAPAPAPAPAPKEIQMRARTATFVKPTIDEVRAYCLDRGYTFDPASFVDYFESIGWKIGGKAPMKDWKAAVNNWARRQKGFESNGTTGGKHEPEPVKCRPLTTEEVHAQNLEGMNEQQRAAYCRRYDLEPAANGKHREGATRAS